MHHHPSTGVRLLPLSQGLFTLVDADVYPWASAFKWTASNGYAMRWTSRRFGPRKAVYLHQQIIEQTAGFVSDHINGDTLDNRRENLRPVTHAQNLQNRRGAQINSRSGIRGVSWHKAGAKWRAEVKVHGRVFYLGLFDTIEAADAAARNGRARYMTHSLD